jgi:hypothetical protein
MSEARRQLLTAGALVFAAVATLLLYAVNLIPWTAVLPVFLAFVSVWLLALAVARAHKPLKYERSAFSTMSVGVLLMALSAAWLAYAYHPVYALVIVLVAVGCIAIAAGLRHK